MIEWILFMPFIWLMDYFYGIINPHFREAYLAVQENLIEYMQEYEDKKLENEK